MRAELRLLRLVTPYRALLGFGLVTTMLASLLDGFTLVMLVPLLKHLFGTAGSLRAGSTQLEALIDRLVDPLIAGLSPGQAAGRLVVLLVIGLVLKNTMSYASTQLSVRTQEGLVRDLRTRLFGHLLTLELGFFQRTRAGQLISGIITEVDQTKTVISASLLSFFQNLVVVAVTLFILSQISLRLTLLTLAFVPFLLLGLQALLRRLRGHARARAHERGEITATVSERLGAIRLIRSYGEEARETSHFGAQADRYRKRVIRTQRFSSLTSPVTEVFSGFLVILIIWAGTKPGLVGLTAPLAPETIIVFLLAALKLTSPLKTIASFPATMAVTLASAERVFDFLDEPSTEVDRPGDEIAKFDREIAFDRVSFRYGDGDLVLRDVSFSLGKGRIVALVGPSGAGKTTIADLVPRFHDPTIGQILMDGVPLTRIGRRSLRALMGVVSQDTVLLNDTVRGNIAYGSPGATPEMIEAAAQAANAAGFIAELPQGYDTMLGERGTRLSGGQRQRIAIARALLRDPPILILDEATSALDTESERLVQQAIERLMRERTVLVIAHRLATVRDADEIVVLDAGRVVQRGSHEELLRAGGLYRRLYDLQFRGEEPAVTAL
ncbi:MAG: ATP-binding cassette, subfamily bacterial MsbA [Gemmatimonadales bacterium]|nr:ATP-binding cassette, subfamily bacterial MsbA [Gemmatimonadales bacterium]